MTAGNIYLIGFMGAGKTAVARQLSRLSGLPCLEMDDEIVKDAGMPITEIFAAEGEAGFRKRETRILKQIGSGQRSVVSCGGGAVLREENVRIMRETGTIVLLTATPETIFERVRYSRRRPILNGHMELSYIRDLMEQRRPCYEKAAERTVAVDGRSTEEIAREIMSAWEVL